MTMENLDNDETLTDIEEQLENSQLELEQRCEQFATILAMADEIQRTGEVSKRTVMSLEHYQPGSLHPDTPIASYTTIPSQQNLSYAQESINWAGIIAALSIAGAIGSMLYALVNMFNRSRAQSFLSQTVKNIHKARELDQDYEDILSKQSSDQKSTSISFKELAEQTHRASSTERTLLSALRPGGDIAQAAEEISGELDELLDDLRVRLKKLDEHFAKIGSRPVVEIAHDLNDLIVDLDRNKTYQRIQKLIDFVNGIEVEDALGNIIRGPLRSSEEYLEFIERLENWQSEVRTARRLQDLGIERTLKKLEEQAKTLQKRSEEVQRQSDQENGIGNDSQTLKKTVKAVSTNVQYQIQLLRNWYRYAYYTYALFYAQLTQDYINYSRARNRKIKDG